MKHLSPKTAAIVWAVIILVFIAFSGSGRKTEKERAEEARLAEETKRAQQKLSEYYDQRMRQGTKTPEQQRIEDSIRRNNLINGRRMTESEAERIRQAAESIIENDRRNKR